MSKESVTCSGCGVAGEREELPPRYAQLLNVPWCCDECSARLDAEDLEREQRARREEERAEVNRRVQLLPTRLRRVSIDDLQHDEANEAAIRAARKWGAGDLRGLMLCGPVGTGKTTLAAAATRMLMARRPVAWAPVPLMLANALGAFDSDERAAAMSAITGAGALVLDDLDKVRATEWASAQLFAAVDARYAADAPLLITSNLTPGEISGRLFGEFGDAVASRLVEHCRVVVIDSADRRLHPASRVRPAHRGLMGAPSTHVTFAIAPLALSKPDAAAALGIAVDSFERYVMADVRCVRRGRLRLYPVTELQRWLDENAERLLAGLEGA